MLTDKQYQIVYAYILKEDDHEPIKVSDAIAKICRTHRIPGKITKKIEVQDIPDILSYTPDIAFVCGWRSIISGHLYNHIPLGCFAAHDSLLPQYRGCAPTVWSIINGEDKTGVSLFKIDDGEVDSGDITGQIEIPISPDDTMIQVYPKVIEATVRLYEELLVNCEKGSIPFQEQDHSQATYASRRTPEDGRIDWSQSDRQIYNLIRALQSPYPYAWTTCRGQKIFVKKISLYEDILPFNSGYPGRIVSFHDNGVVVSCGEGQVILEQLVDEKGKLCPPEELIKSLSDTLGEMECRINENTV